MRGWSTFSLSDDLQILCEVTERIPCAPQTSRSAAGEVTCFVQVAQSPPCALFQILPVASGFQQLFVAGAPPRAVTLESGQVRELTVEPVRARNKTFKKGKKRYKKVKKKKEQRYRGTEVQRYKGTKYKGLKKKGTKVLRHKGTKVQRGEKVRK